MNKKKEGPEHACRLYCHWYRVRNKSEKKHNTENEHKNKPAKLKESDAGAYVYHFSCEVYNGSMHIIQYYLRGLPFLCRLF